MKIEGYRCPNSNGYKIKTIVYNKKLNISHNVDFLVDTGCTITTINLFDAFRLNLLSLFIHYPVEYLFNLINIHKLLFGYPSITANGIIQNLLLSDVQLIFKIPPDSIFIEKIQHISISFPDISLKNSETLTKIPSLLGMDVIKNYRLEFINDKIILER